MRYFIADGDDRKGPFTPEELARQGIERDTLVWHEGMPDWKRADEVPALADLVAAQPPPVPRRQPPPRPPRDEYDSFSRWVRYNPGTFKKLFVWFVILVGAALTLAAVGAVLVIISHNMRIGRQVMVWDQFQRRNVMRWDTDWAAHDRRQLLEALGVLGFLVAGALLIAAMILFYVTLYKSWNQIQDGRARASAGQAVGFMFIPFFNFYWWFVAIYGLALDLHRYVTRHGLIPRVGPFPVTPGIALTVCILMVCNVIPLVGFVTFLPTLVMLIVLMSQLRRAGAGIAAARLVPEGLADEPAEHSVPQPEEAHPEHITRRPDSRPRG